MLDHHSYSADHNRRARARDNHRRSYEQEDYAAELSRRSEAAGAHMGARYSPVTVGNRIEKLEAERRGVGCQLAGEGALETYTDQYGRTGERSVIRPPVGASAARLDLDEQIAYWKDVYAKLQAEGKASNAGPDTVAKGDFVRVRGCWYRVRRVNKKTVSVPSHSVKTPEPDNREYTDTTPWHEVSAYRRAEQMPKAFVDAYEEPGGERRRLKLSDFPDDTVWRVPRSVRCGTRSVTASPTGSHARSSTGRRPRSACCDGSLRRCRCHRSAGNPRRYVLVCDDSPALLADD